MINLNKKLLAVLLVCALLAGSGLTMILMSSGAGGTVLLSEEEYEQSLAFKNRYAKLDALREAVEQYYYTDVDEDALLEGAYKGMVEGLGDKYSEYVPAESNESFTNEITGEFYGIGVTFFMNDNGNVEIETVHLDSPAEKGGLRAGDQIYKVDGEIITGMTSDEAKDKIRGEKGTVVEIGYLRDGVEYTTKCTRAKLSELSVASTMLDGDIGYIRISSFLNNTGNEFAEHLAKMESQGAKALIVDLRYNGGGLVDAAVDVADQLMNNGTIAYAVAKDGSKESYIAKDGRTSLPYAILVNGYTASASEILSIGVQDNNEGIIVGTQTFGKGIIQGTMTLQDGSLLKITFMEYYSPSGETIHKVGVTPDYIVELPSDATEDTQLNKAIELLEK